MVATLIAAALAVLVGRIYNERSFKRANYDIILELEKQIQNVQTNPNQKKGEIEEKISNLDQKIQDIQSVINTFTERIPQSKTIKIRDNDQLEQLTKNITQGKLNAIGIEKELEPAKKISPNDEIEDLITADSKLENLREELLQKQTTFNKEDSILEANYYFYTGRYDKASRIYRRILRQFPDDFCAIVNNGIALYRLGKLEEAEQFLDKALKINENNDDALVYKAHVLYRLGKLKEAKPYYEKIAKIEIDKSNIDALVNKATALERLGKKEEAIRYYRKAVDIKIDENNADAFVNNGIAFDGLGRLEGVIDRHKEAMSNFDRALKIDQNNAFALYAKACNYSLQGKFDDALNYLKQAIELYPGYKNMANAETDFEKLKNDERFKKLVN